MLQYLDITPGSVSVLGLMNDTENRVQLVIDKPVYEAETLCCHPCINSATLQLSMRDIVEKFLPHVRHTPIVVDLPEPAEQE